MKKIEGLIPAIVQHADTGQVLMLGYMNQEAFDLTQETGLVTFYSRSREQIWVKGESSGNFLDLVSLHEDCDQDAILVLARPRGPTCHTGAKSCFGEVIPEVASLAFLADLQNTIDSRFESRPEGSYVSKLIARGLDRMAQKVGEEAVETVIAAKNRDQDAFLGEAADLLFHLMVLLRAKGLGLNSIVEKLETRSR